MATELIIAPEARQDVDDAYRWYEIQRPGLGEEFLDCADDGQCRQQDITQPVLLEYCRKLISYLIEVRGIPLNDLLRFKYQLAKVVQQKITACRKQA